METAAFNLPNNSMAARFASLAALIDVRACFFCKIA